MLLMLQTHMYVYNWTRSKLIWSTTVNRITTEVTKQAIQYYITGILFSGSNKVHYR